MTSGVIKVIVVTYNSAGEIAACLDALLSSSERYAFEITVVDNGSTDETLQKIRNLHPSVHVIASSNLGYAHGCNLGVREALESGRQYRAILILNPDVRLGAGTMDGLSDALFSAPDVGGVSPHVVERSGQEGGRLKTLFGFPMNDRPVPGRNIVDSDRLHGCCMLVHPEIFKKAGYLDEHYFLYWEELDFGLRAIGAGFKLLLCYDVIVYHRCDSQERQHRIYYMWRNQFRFAGRIYAFLPRVLFLARRGLGLLKELAGFVISKRLDLVRAAMAGLAAGLNGEIGKSTNRYAVPPDPALPNHDNS